MKLQAIYIAASLFFSCIKSNNDTIPKTGTVIFYTRNPSQDRRWTVTIKGVVEGAVPYTHFKPFCDQSNSAGGLYVTLPLGQYTADFKSLDGYPPYSVELFITEGCYPYR